MPRRKVIVSTGEIYHVYNRSINKQPIFNQKKLINQFFKTLEFYIKENPPVKFSRYKEVKNPDIYPSFGDELIQIYGYVLMPNHFHFLIKQLKDKGIQIFLQRLINSYSHYYNLINERKGPLFEGVFKSVQITSGEQFKHVLRYIDLNPTSSALVGDPGDYLYSSYLAHIGKVEIPWIDASFITKEFNSFDRYKKFVLNNKDYQKSLNEVKNIILE